MLAPAPVPSPRQSRPFPCSICHVRNMVPEGDAVPPAAPALSAPPRASTSPSPAAKRGDPMVVATSAVSSAALDAAARVDEHIRALRADHTQVDPKKPVQVPANLQASIAYLEGRKAAILSGENPADAEPQKRLCTGCGARTIPLSLPPESPAVRADQLDALALAMEADHTSVDPKKPVTMPPHVSERIAALRRERDALRGRPPTAPTVAAAPAPAA